MSDALMKTLDHWRIIQHLNTYVLDVLIILMIKAESRDSMVCFNML